MEKYGFRALSAIRFLLLFFVNVFVVSFLAFNNGSRLTWVLIAVVLIAAQFIIIRQWQQKPGERKLPFVLRIVRDHMISYCSLMVRWFRDLEVSDKMLIRRRARSKSAGLINRRMLQDGGYEYLVHYDDRRRIPVKSDRVEIGGPQCSKPYSISVLNAATPAYLTENFLQGLSHAASMAGFAVFTGENGMQSAHIRGGGDLIWQFKLKAFQIKDFDHSDEVFFRRNASRPYIKMIELSVDEQEPRTKNQISRNGIEPDSDIAFPEILLFIDKIRRLSGGKPVGIRMNSAQPEAISVLCSAVISMNIFPDFITIDQEARPRTKTSKRQENFDAFRSLALTKARLEHSGIHMAILFEGHIVSEFDILKAAALGASACISSEGLAFAGLQEAAFWKNKGVDKSWLIANFHRSTITAMLKLMGMCGYKSLSDVNPADFYHCSPGKGLITLRELFKGGAPLHLNTEKNNHTHI